MTRPARLLSRFRDHWQLVALTALVFLHWNTYAALPLKILTVFLHELSHAAAAVATGGTVEEFTIAGDQSGHVLSRGGNPFVIWSAGYLGSLFIGMALFMLAVRTRADRVFMAALGVLLLAVTALYFRTPFPLIFGGIGGVAMLASAAWLGRAANDLMLRVIGLTSLIYVPYDIWSDTIARSGLRSDARMLAEYYGGATVLWGGLWLIISLVMIGICLRYGLGPSSSIAFRTSPALPSERSVNTRM
ncbi:MAG: M50 family metallopeptidase [Albidovulum sp.]|uniref:M50 family metallopeptidase n=1 Tax=Albidovulum sp. TaxID=1872424 RepID=UPI003CB52973